MVIDGIVDSVFFIFIVDYLRDFSKELIHPHTAHFKIKIQV